MIKSIFLGGTALLMLCSGILTSCSDKNEEGGGTSSNPTVALSISDATVNTLKFTLTLSNADKCSYVCIKASETIPAAAKILAEGKSVTASGTIMIDQLLPSTSYRLCAVASKNQLNSKVETIEHTTSVPDVRPAVALTAGAITPTTLAFTAQLTESESAAYVCLEKSAGMTIPTAAEIIRDGKAIAQSGEIIVKDLKTMTKYVIAAAVVNTGVYSDVETLEMETGIPAPTITATAGATSETTLAFAFSFADADKAAYVCVEKVGNVAGPSAEEVLRDGTSLSVAGGTATIEKLKPGTTYTIYIAASNKTVSSKVKWIEMTTDKDLSGPAVFDRQVAGGYYGVPVGFRYGEFQVVLADAETVEVGGVHTTIGAGRAMIMDLYQMEPYNLDKIELPARNYRYATTKNMTTFDPAKTYCMVNDGKGKITKIEFKAGAILVEKPAGSTNYTITATLTTTDDKEFTASYTGPIKIENKVGEVVIPDLPALEKDVTNMAFVRVLASYYNGDTASADNCIVRLYDVEPTVSTGSDYLGRAGHMVALDLSTAASASMQLQEGTYNVSASGTPGSYYPGEQTEFMETMLATGTYCEERNDKNESVYGLVASGTVTISKSGSGYKFALDFTTDKGHKISGTYEGKVEMTDKREN